MPEYLSVGFSRSILRDGEGAEKGKTASVSINGNIATIEQLRKISGHHEYGTSYGEYKEMELLSNETELDDKILIKLFWKGNTDVAVLANHFAKDDWSLFKVRDKGQYLLFQRR